MNSKSYQEQKTKFKIGDLVCYKNFSSRRLCGIITEINKIPDSSGSGDLIKVYWHIDREEVDISPLSFPPIRKDGWIAAGLLQGIGNLKVLSKKD